MSGMNYQNVYGNNNPSMMMNDGMGMGGNNKTNGINFNRNNEGNNYLKVDDLKTIGLKAKGTNFEEKYRQATENYGYFHKLCRLCLM